MAGITEMPLSMEQKIANIEATEAAKKAMLSIVPGDDEEGGGGSGGAARRGMYPPSFGRQSSKYQQVIAEAQ